MVQTCYDEESVQLAELKSSIRKLIEIYDKIGSLISRKFSAYGSGNSWGETLERAESKVEPFSRTLSKLVKIRKKLHSSLTTLGNNLKSLENAESVGEISTLIGLTVLADLSEYNDAAAHLMKSYENELLPIIPKLTNLLNIAATANETGKMINHLLDFNATTGEDDFARMATALRDRDIDKFNRIYLKVKQRIEIEERH